MKLTTYFTIILGVLTITFIGLQILDSQMTAEQAASIINTKYGVY